ncbi:hypothetical protein MUO93_06810 [Candidatus Bathyarchaeota archaeon]|nr:hypothetical protein [Candidatus Bathyarchaeota archaeon]
MSKKHAGYAFIPVKPETRTALIKFKRYGDTYDTVINMLIHQAFEVKAEDFAAQNVDHDESDDQERGA